MEVPIVNSQKISHVDSSPTQKEIPLHIFRETEQFLLPLRQAVLIEATRIFREHNPGGTVLTLNDVKTALKNLAESGDLPSSPKETVNITSDDYSWLDRQLDTFRSKIFEMAPSYQADSEHTKVPLPDGAVTAAGNVIWSHKEQRRAALGLIA